ncbi:ABC-three component system protein [Lactococcus garvieae]|uniref:ABC-three component system protein n=1 Tax=Lactococcus garvieae TaxID=1363 RepID=UPI0030D468ED
MQKGLNANQTETGQLLFGVLERNEYVPSTFNADSTFLSLLNSRQREIPKKVAKASLLPEVIDEVKHHFSKVIYPRLNPQLVDDTCGQIMTLLESDPSVSEEKQIELGAYRQQMSAFLAACFLYALNRKNKREKTKKLSIDEIPVSKIRSENGKLFIHNQAITLDRHLQVPADIEKAELPYVKALLAAYTDAEHLYAIEWEEASSFFKKFSKYRRNFDGQRQNYYDAESIRRGVRDTFDPKEYEHQFSELKNDLFNGICDVAEEDYNNGFERLREVLKQALLISLDRSDLAQLGVIGNGHRKGMCHLLVNDGRLTWVNQDDTSF